MTRPTVEERVSPQELNRREVAVKAAMETRGFDALLIAGAGPHFRLGHLRYLTNWCQPLFEEYYLLPLRGQPVYFSRYSARAHLQSTVFGLNARYPEYGVGLEAARDSMVSGSVTSNIPPSFVVQGIRECGVRSLGICGPETMSGDFYFTLAGELNRAAIRFESASDMLWEIRMIKSPEEQEWLRKSAAVGLIGFEAFLNTVSVGKREYEVFAEADRAQQLAGAETSFYMMASGWEPLLKFPDMAYNTYAPGDLALFQTETAMAGYYTEVIRTISIGKADEEVCEAHAAAVEAKEAAAKKLAPGNRACDAYQAIAEMARTSGYDIGNQHPGHGQGLDILEPPLVSQYDTTVLRPGMLVTIHPGFRTPSGRKVHLGDSYLIRESGPEALSTTDKRIIEIPV